MWKLVNEKGDIFRIPEDKVVSVSRKIGDLILGGDHSVSREHAFLEVKSPGQDGVLLWDEKSKFGTFVNDSESRIEATEKVILKDGDRVRFGRLHNTWKLVRQFCVSSSKLSAGERKNLMTLLSQIGGTYQNNWTEHCSHLTMSAITLTIKLVCALACGKPIVTPAFWEQVKNAQCTSKSLPNIVDFIPPFADNINRRKETLLPNVSRKTLFMGKTFVFPSEKDVKKYGCMVELAGAKAVDCSVPMSSKELSNPNVIVVQHDGPDDMMSSLYKSIIGQLQKLKKRCILEKDISFAIMDLSLDVFSNPINNLHELLPRVDRLNSESEFGAVVAVSTEEIPSVEQSFDSVVIPPSCSSSKSGDAENSSTVENSPVGKWSRNANNNPQSSEDTMLGSDSETMELSFYRNNSQMLQKQKSNSHQREACNNVSVLSKRKLPSPSESTQDRDVDDFVIPSPRKSVKRRKMESFENEDDADLFDLPAKPSSPVFISKVKNDDSLEFDMALNHRRNAKKEEPNCLSTSMDLFNDSEDIFGSVKPSLKRKLSSDEHETSNVAKHSRVNCVSGFLSKGDSQVKEEINSDDMDSNAAQLAACLRDKMTVNMASLIVRHAKQKEETADNSPLSSNNFKKFKKVWKPPVDRKVITGNELQMENLVDSSLFKSNQTREEKDEFLNTVEHRRRDSATIADETDEWSFHPRSQVV